MPEPKPKNPIVEREEKVLKFWQENKIFEKSVAKIAPQGEFIFYEGPPTANGKPGIHHLEARAFKDAIPRYKTMQGFKVRRKGGWDTHGLAVEIQTEKELGLKSKKEIETYGIEAFNKKCRESVWRYVKEWEEFTGRIGYWVDLKRPYVTCRPYYIESLWNIVSKINEQGLLYKDYKVVPWCPRCGTGLSSHELAQGYEDVKDLSVTVKFLVNEKYQALKFGTKEQPLYLLAWTTTPWTLPGNVALAINPSIDYVLVDHEGSFYYLAEKRVKALFGENANYVSASITGISYKPLYPFLKDNLSESEKEKLGKAFQVYTASFVTAEDGTGIVHTAVMYGTDDFELGTKVGLPKHHLVKEDGTFKEETGFLSGKFVKDPDTDVAIIKDLAGRGRLFAKEKYAHSYPHCWRCHTPLIYFARDSWYIKMSALRDKLVAENEKINWEPSYIKDGRFGEWLKDIKDWAISRERYWGTPLPVWECAGCGKRKVVGSFNDLYEQGTSKKLTRLILIRHGESEKNILGLFDSSKDKYPLTKAGEDRAKLAGEKVKNMNVAAIYASPVLRTRQTAEIIGKAVGKTPTLSDALWEVRSGEWDGKKDVITEVEPERIAYNKLPHDAFYKAPRGKTGESWQDVENRAVDFAKEILKKHQGETVVLVSHEGPLMTLMRYFKDLSLDDITNLWEESRTFHQGLLGGYAEPTPVYIDNRTGKEIDPHRPFIDELTLGCECGNPSTGSAGSPQVGSGRGEMKRVKEVMDVWFDSGAMPFAEEHYPFKNKELIDTTGYPADFISEAIDQTRGWFYTLHAIGTLMGKGRAYKNVICLGHILDAEGKKMSKSIGNVVDPNLMIEKYGADALRFWMYSVNQPGEPKNFDEKTVDEVVKKVFNLAGNVLAFYKLYESENSKSQIPNHKQIQNSKIQIPNSENVLDRWILARLNQLIIEVTAGLEKYKLLEPTRAIRDFIADLSQWYLRRSRERIKSGGEDGQAALATLRFVLGELSKIMAPFTPFFAEFLYKEVGGTKESVHLESWLSIDSRLQIQDSGILEQMQEVRRVVSLALEQRAKVNVKVRQPLTSLKLKSKILNLKSKLLELIKDEVNVKEVVCDGSILGEVELDATITPELKEEGGVRELIRAIQDLRKETGLNAGDLALLTVDADEKGKKFVEKHEQELIKATQLKKITFATLAQGAEVVFDSFSLKIAIDK
ncbi:MAG: Isoleucine-tRNA ligase [Parcubacteria group bacterium GW2011_GWA2_47_16]|nr:MAG: Isoleucine-tRNA ligase [Parcubacteria group bacterium GW2011_GWA2_47_16]